MKAKDLVFASIHEKCKGCANVDSSKGRLGYAKCKIYLLPSAWWVRGYCPLATHLEPGKETPLEKMQRRFRIGQQKQRRNR